MACDLSKLSCVICCRLSAPGLLGLLRVDGRRDLRNHLPDGGEGVARPLRQRAHRRPTTSRALISRGSGEERSGARGLSLRPVGRRLEILPVCLRQELPHVVGHQAGGDQPERLIP